MQDQNPYAPPTAKVDDVQPAPSSGVAPALWRPGAAALWSLFLTPVFGAVLHMKNWQALGEPERAKASKAWAWISVAFFLIAALGGALLGDSRTLDALGRVGGLVLVVAWYFGSARAQQEYVFIHYAKDYPHKGWLKPLALALAAFAGFIIVFIILGSIVVAVTRQ